LGSLCPYDTMISRHSREGAINRAKSRKASVTQSEVVDRVALSCDCRHNVRTMASRILKNTWRIACPSVTVESGKSKAVRIFDKNIVVFRFVQYYVLPFRTKGNCRIQKGHRLPRCFSLAPSASVSRHHTDLVPALLLRGKFGRLGALIDRYVFQFHVFGRSHRAVLALRGSDGCFVWFRCCHRGTPLSQGEVLKRHNRIRCSTHGWEFDATGKCVSIPTLPEGESIPEGCGVQSFRTFESDGYIWVWMGDGGA
jgi:nitrite reductase/ring-hydroxylating ferredoxin subunit